jgi:hypothetical protein
MQVSNSTKLQKLTCSLVCVGTLAYMVAIVAAMAYYAGGNSLNSAAAGYSFWLNTLSDLGKEVAISGRPNAVSSVLYRTGMAALSVALVAMWQILPATFPKLRRLGRAVKGLGLASVLSAVAVALTPVDLYPFGHGLAIAGASIPAVAALALATVAMLRDRACPCWYAGLTVGFLAVALVHFGQFIQYFVLGIEWGWIEPATQKIAAIYCMGWVLLTALRAWPGASKAQALGIARQ